MNILVIRLSALGDVAMTIPVIYSVATVNPNHSFIVVTSEFPSKLFINRPFNVEVLAIKKEESHGIKGTCRMLKMLSSKHIDAVADLHSVLRSWVVDVVYMLKAVPVKILNKGRRQRWIITHQHATSTQSMIQRYFEVFSHMGLKTDESLFETLFSCGLPVFADGIPMKKNALWIGVAPFARYRSKTYDEKLMQNVITSLVDECKCHVFLFGAAGNEKNKLLQWANGQERVMVVAGRLNLEEELALMSRLDVMLTMDSANMHLASLVRTRVVSLWCGTTPACGFLGYKQDENDALYADIPCQPCTIAGSNYCKNGTWQCTKSVLPGTIIEKLLQYNDR